MKKWAKVLSLSLSLPSLMLGSFYALNLGVKNKLITQQTSMLLFFLLITSVLGLLIYYAKQN